MTNYQLLALTFWVIIAIVTVGIVLYEVRQSRRAAARKASMARHPAGRGIAR